jgi:hypothetical protein
MVKASILTISRELSVQHPNPSQNDLRQICQMPPATALGSSPDAQRIHLKWSLRVDVNLRKSENDSLGDQFLLFLIACFFF